MPRKALIRTADFPYHVHGRVNNREWYPIPLSDVWQIYRFALKGVREEYGLVTHAFVLMGNHFHWLVSTPNSNLDAGMRWFMATTSRKISIAAGRINRLYGGRYGWTLIGSPRHYACAFRYIYLNPVRAGICKEVADYPWSTWKDNSLTTPPSDIFNEGLPDSHEDLEAWIREFQFTEDYRRTKSALRQSIFKFPKV